MEKTQGNLIFLGFDFGLRRIGTAVGQSVTRTASPLAIIKAQNGIPNWQEVDSLIAKWQPKALIVGVPVNFDGTNQEMTKYARDFAAQLHARYHLPIHEIDERLTTKSAREEIYEKGGYKALQKEPIDSIAAKLILEDWMREN
jgi:putative Holliday junction resolvase